MPVLYACYEFHPVVAQPGIESLYQLVALLGSQVSAVMVLYPSVLYLYDVASYRHVLGSHLVAYARCLKRASAFIDLVEVVTQNSRVGNLAARHESCRYGVQASCFSLSCEHVHVWCVGILHWGLASESSHSMVCHAVAKYYNVFHVVVQ